MLYSSGAPFKLLVFYVCSVDPATCVSDVGRADILFRDFAQEAEASNVSMALTSLSRGLYAVSTAVSPCGLDRFQNKVLNPPIQPP